MKRIAERGTIKDFRRFPKKVRQIFVVSHDVRPEWHIRIQAAFQRYTDNAVSKTINFSDRGDARRMSTRLTSWPIIWAARGLTIYRDGSRDAQVLAISSASPSSPQVEPRPRPDHTTGVTEGV